MSYKKLAGDVSAAELLDLNLSHNGLSTINQIPLLPSLKPVNSHYLEPLLPYTEASGFVLLAELQDAPQGRHLGLFSTISMFVSRIVGLGFLAISSGIYTDCGQSPAIFLLAWLVAAALAFSGLYVYLELGALIPRSGGTKVFLETTYKRPKMMMSVVISLYSVMFGFTISNVLVFGEYILRSFGLDASGTQIRITGLAFLWATCAIHGFSVHHGVRVQNILGALKLVLALIIVLTGFYVVLLPSSVTGVELQMGQVPFFKPHTKISFSLFASAVIKATFAFAGWNSIHTVTNEIKDPTRTLKIAGPASLAIVTITYVVINVTYLWVIPDEELASSGQLVGSVLFEKIFGYRIGRQLLTFSLALCTGGNVFVVLYTISRASQEVFREGYLPYSNFMASNWPVDAPLPTLALSCVLSTLVVCLSPSGNVYNYVVSLESYPQQLFIALCAVSIFILRKKYPNLRAPIRLPVIGTVLVISISLYLLILPLTGNPNPVGTEYWIPYTYLGLFCIFLCVVYWYGMFVARPYFGKYELVAEEIEQADGLVIKEWRKMF